MIWDETIKWSDQAKGLDTSFQQSYRLGPIIAFYWYLRAC